MSQPDEELDLESERIALANAALHGVCDMIAAYPECNELDALSALIHVFCERALQRDLIAGEELEGLWPDLPAPWDDEWNDKQWRQEMHARAGPKYLREYAELRAAVADRAPRWDHPITVENGVTERLTASLAAVAAASDGEGSAGHQATRWRQAAPLLSSLGQRTMPADPINTVGFGSVIEQHVDDLAERLCDTLDSALENVPDVRDEISLAALADVAGVVSACRDAVTRDRLLEHVHHRARRCAILVKRAETEADRHPPVGVAAAPDHDLEPAPAGHGLDPTRSLVTVGRGRGFVVAATDDPDNHFGPFVITAAHCLSKCPTPQGFRGLRAETFDDLLAPLGEPATVAARCLFVDPVADIAVLGSPRRQHLAEEAATAYHALIATTRPLEIRDVAAFDWPIAARLVALDCRLTDCTVDLRDIFLNIENAVDGITQGMSGSPILDHSGAAIGIITDGRRWISGQPDGEEIRTLRLTEGWGPCLVSSLPGWLLLALGAVEARLDQIGA